MPYRIEIIIGYFLVGFSTLFAIIGNDIIISIIGISAGLALGILSIYQRIDDNRHEVLKKRLQEEVSDHDETRRILEKYKNLYGPLKKENNV